jgi:hypothetical protein
MSSLFRAASLFALIAMGAAILPKVDLPETAFDETDAPTIQTILTTKAAPFRQCIPVGAAASMDVARKPKPRVRPLFPAYTAKRSESRPFWALCSLRC